jgi:hypothetical protein
MSQAETFAHFDKIAAVKPGTVLLVCEPIKTWYGGTPHDLGPGLWLRVLDIGIMGLYAQVAIDGRVLDVRISNADFTSLEIKAP